MSGYARKFAQKKYSLNIFIMSMCRVYIDRDSLNKIESNQDIDATAFSYFKEDALGKNTCQGFKYPGRSIMIFDVV